MGTSHPWARPQHAARVLPVLLGVGLTIAAFLCRGDNGPPSHPSGPPEPAKWGPAMLTFAVAGCEVWGTTGVGERPRPLLAMRESASSVGQPQWSPDGRRLVFPGHMAAGEPPGIWVATYSTAQNTAGSPECLCRVGLRPRLSPDGSLLACTRADKEEDLSFGDPQLIVARLGQQGDERETTDLTPLIERFFVPTIFTRHYMDVTWSPSGRMLATSFFRIVLIDLDTHTAREVDSGAIPLHPPQWSPDGEHLAFSWWPPVPVGPDGRYMYPGPEAEISVINRDGTGLTNVTRDPRADEHPMWSPDGRLIAFLRGEKEKHEEPEPAPPSEEGFPLILGDSGPPRYSYAVWVMNADGANQRQLTPEGVRDDGLTDEGVAWSPDGRWIAYKTDRIPPGEDRLWVVGLDGSAPQEVAADLHGIGDIAWRPAMPPSPKKPE